MAGSRTYRTKALVLDKTKLKETDLILTMLDERGRQVRAVAKGARKPGGRLAARCELFCTVDMLLAHGRSLDVVSQAELMEAPLGVAPDYETTCAASAIAEVARVCSFEDAEDPFTFAITQRALALVGSGLDTAHMDLLVAAYVFKLLSHVGYRQIFRPACCAETPCCRIFHHRRAAHVRIVRVERSGCRARVDRRGRMAARPHIHDLRCAYGRANRPAYGGILAWAFACLGCDAHRSAPPCDGIHVGSVMMRRRGLLVVTYRPVGTSTLVARSTGGFPVRGESSRPIATQNER